MLAKLDAIDGSFPVELVVIELDRGWLCVCFQLLRCACVTKVDEVTRGIFILAFAVVSEQSKAELLRGGSQLASCLKLIHQLFVSRRRFPILVISFAQGSSDADSSILARDRHFVSELHFHTSNARHAANIARGRILTVLSLLVDAEGGSSCHTFISGGWEVTRSRCGGDSKTCGGRRSIDFGSAAGTAILRFKYSGSKSSVNLGTHLVRCLVNSHLERKDLIVPVKHCHLRLSDA